MNEILKKVVIALTAACAAAIGTSLGNLASEAIKKRWAPDEPEEPPEPETKKKTRRSNKKR